MISSQQPHVSIYGVKQFYPENEKGVEPTFQ